MTVETRSGDPTTRVIPEEIRDVDKKIKDLSLELQKLWENSAQIDSQTKESEAFVSPKSASRKIRELAVLAGFLDPDELAAIKLNYSYNDTLPLCLKVSFLHNPREKLPEDAITSIMFWIYGMESYSPKEPYVDDVQFTDNDGDLISLGRINDGDEKFRTVENLLTNPKYGAFQLGLLGDLVTTLNSQTQTRKPAQD